MKKLVLFLFVIAAICACSKSSSGTDDNTGGDGDKGTVVDGWTIKEIADIYPTGDISAACDNNNKLHVCISGYDDAFKYSTNKSGSWVTTNILNKATSIILSPSNDIAVDNNNKVHMVYSTYYNGSGGDANLYYATDKSGKMVNDIIYTEPSSMLSGVGIAATKDGHVHIVFGNIDMKLVYLTNVSGSWVQTIIDSYWTSVRPRLVLDANENVYVIYEHGYEHALKLQLINSSGGLVNNTVLDNNGTTGWTPAIAINKSNNAIYAIYWNYDTQTELFYNNGTIETIETCNWPTGGIVVDKSGFYHFVYSNSPALKYVTNKSGSMVTTTLPKTTASTTANIVVESTGKIDIVYLDGKTYHLTVMSK